MKMWNPKGRERLSGEEVGARSTEVKLKMRCQRDDTRNIHILWMDLLKHVLHWSPTRFTCADLIRSITTTSIVAFTRAHLRGERGRTRELRIKATPLKLHPQKFNLISHRCTFDPTRLNICKAQPETEDISIPFRCSSCSKKISTSHWLDHRLLVTLFYLSRDSCSTFYTYALIRTDM